MTTLQLQLWTGKAYEPVETREDRESFDADIAELRRRRRSWRIVKLGLLLPISRTNRALALREDWPLKPTRLRQKPRPIRTTHSILKNRDVITDYLVWAVGKGLKRVTVYAGCGYIAKGAGLSYTEVDPADFLGPADVATELQDAA